MLPYDLGEFHLEHNSIVIYEYIDLIPWVIALLVLIIHIAFAVATFEDAMARRRADHLVWFVHPIFWGGATLLGGVFVAAVYWAMHYSTLVSVQQLAQRPANAQPEKPAEDDPVGRDE